MEREDRARSGGVKERARRAISNVRRSLRPETVEDRNIFYNALDGLTVGLAAPAMSLLSVFVVRLGANAFWVSLLSSLPSLVKLLFTLPLSRFVERQTKSVPVFAWSRMIGRSMYLLIGLLPFFLPYDVAARAIVLLWGAVAIVGGVQQISFSLVMNRATRPERRAVLVSARWTVMGVAKVATLALSGLVLEYVRFPLNYQVLFLFSFLAAMSGFLTIGRIQTTEPLARPEKPRAAQVPFWRRLASELREVLRHKPFVRFAAGRNVYWLGMSMIMPLVPIYYVENLQATDAWVASFTTALSLTSLLSYPFWIWLKRKHGNRTALLAAVLGRTVHPALVAFTRTAPVMLAISLYNGIAFAGLNLMFFDAFLDTLPKGREARYLALNQTLIGVIGFIGPPLGATLYAAAGIQAALIGGSILAFVGFLVFLVAGVAKPASPRESVGLRTAAD